MISTSKDKLFIATSRIFITVEGDFDEEEAHKICHDKFKFDRGNIENIEREHKEHPEERLAHKTLAKEIITFIHGEEEYNKAIKISKALFSGNIKELNAKEIEAGFKDVPSFNITDNVSIIHTIATKSKYIGILVIIAILATSPPKASEPTSPIKIFAGL